MKKEIYVTATVSIVFISTEDILSKSAIDLPMMPF